MAETIQDRWTRMHAAEMVRWMPGMVDGYGDRVLDDYGDGRVVTSRIDGYDHMIEEPSSTLVPDFNDPATLGCLLAQAREALMDDSAHTCRTHDETWVLWPRLGNGVSRCCDTEAEALLDAIERAKGGTP